MDAPASSLPYDVDAALRHRAKERLYVICQTAGWGLFLMFQVVFSLLFPNREDHHDPGDTIALLAMMTALGLLLTHCMRPLMTRWGWKQLGWRALVPRVLGTTAVLSFLWSALSFGLAYGPMRIPWTSKYSPALVFFIVWINLATLLIGWLCIYFFYHLFDRFNRSEIERLSLATSVKEAELRALKSQVNPHFIFNSLNSLRGLIEENPGRARQAVTQLANLLRYSLQSGHLETVPFEDELRTVNDYLALEQVRHEERLRVRLDVAPGALHCPVPPMLLQTLVENAVKFGIAPLRAGGEIAVIARCEREHLRIQVTNPGTLAAGGGSTGVGLRNAGERLRLLFGAHAALHLREDPPGRVVAEVSVPLAPASVHPEPGAHDPGRAGRAAVRKTVVGA